MLHASLASDTYLLHLAQPYLADCMKSLAGNLMRVDQGIGAFSLLKH